MFIVFSTTRIEPLSTYHPCMISWISDYLKSITGQKVRVFPYLTKTDQVYKQSRMNKGQYKTTSRIPIKWRKEKGKVKDSVMNSLDHDIVLGVLDMVYVRPSHQPTSLVLSSQVYVWGRFERGW